MKLLCDVYKSPKMEEAYLYVSRKDGLSRLPELLLETFGKPELVLTLILTLEKKLARVEVEKVLEKIEEQGFYLQMPPLKEPYVLDLFCKLDKE